jgi:hypothetical protein
MFFVMFPDCARQDAARPVLYHRISVDSVETMRLLARTLRAHAASNESSFKQIRELNFQGMYMETCHSTQPVDASYAFIGCDAPSQAADLTTVLMEAVNLRSLTAEGYYALTGVAIARRLFKDTIQYLDVETETTGVAMLGYISSFTNLRQLVIRIPVAYDSSKNWKNLRPWDLLRLRSLTVSLWGIRLLVLAEFIGRCYLPALVMLKMKFTHPGPDSSSELATLLKPLNQLDEVTLDVTGVDHSLILPELHVSHLEFVPFSAAMITSLSPMTKTLHIKASDARSRLVELEQMLELLHTTDTGVRTVRIHGSGFMWILDTGTAASLDDVHHSNVALVSHLLAHAEKLAKKGILIRDDSGKTVREHLPASSQISTD